MTLEDSGIVSEYLRPEVLRLAVVMERKLRKNDWKGGWGQLPAELFLLRALEELRELAVVIFEVRNTGPSSRPEHQSVGRSRGCCKLRDDGGGSGEQRISASIPGPGRDR